MAKQNQRGVSSSKNFSIGYQFSWGALLGNLAWIFPTLKMARSVVRSRVMGFQVRSRMVKSVFVRHFWRSMCWCIFKRRSFFFFLTRGNCIFGHCTLLNLSGSCILFVCSLLLFVSCDKTVRALQQLPILELMEIILLVGVCILIWAKYIVYMCIYYDL